MTKGLKYTLYGILAFNVVGIVLALIFSGTIICDSFEHLRMSWLVSQGYVPYRDFFEHHHPLMWYAFAPIIKVLPHDFMLIFYTSRLISAIASCGKFYIIYLILKNYFKDEKLFMYFFASVAVFYPVWYGFSLFKPDTFEYLFYFWGLYCFFKYIDSGKSKFLTCCGICFTIAFLFLQTVIFEIFPLAVYMLWLLYNKKVPMKDLLFAFIPSLVIIGIAAVCLFFSDSWTEYFQLNWILNSKVFSLNSYYVERGTIIHFFALHLLAGFAAIFWLYKKKENNKYINIIALLYVCSVVQHLCFKAYFAHYLIHAFTLEAMLIAPCIKSFFSDKKYKMISIYTVLFLILSCGLNYFTILHHNNIDRNKQMKIINNSDDLCFTVVGNLYGIYNPKLSYYVMQADIASVDNYLYNRYPDYDINDVINKYKPQYLDYDNLQKEKNEKYKVSDLVLSDYVQVHPYLWQRKDTILQ